ncbi:MAG: thioredoxin fold domain-containing protein [Candidatus Aminicenantes bacterium]|nr:thioredoxin fold domain-containing protein [Candidatus Aminicenantes bacterium]
MVKKLATILILMVFLAPVFPKAGKGVCSEVTLSTVKKHIPNFPAAEIVSKVEVGGLCQLIVKAGGKYYPLYVGKDFVIIGEMFRLGKDFTRDTFSAVRAKEMQKIKANFKSTVPEIEKNVVMVYKPSSTAKRVLYMFTDPVCPYCNKAEKQIKQIVKDNNVILKVLFFPVHRPNGWNLANVAICKGLNLNTYIAKEWEKKAKPSKEKCDKGENILKATDNIAKKLEISGVPTFILDNGERVSGADMEALKKLLSTVK